MDIDLTGQQCRACNDRPFELYALADDGEHMVKVCRICLSEIEGETYASRFPIVEFPSLYTQ